MLSLKNWFIAGLFLALTLPIGCSSSPYWPVAPTTQFQPPEHFRAWYAETEACRNLKGNYDLLTFYLVSDVDGNTEFSSKKSTHEGVVGLYDHDRIFLLDCCVEDKPTVVHEMLHHILSFYISGERNAAHDDSLSFYGSNACDLSP